MAFSWWQRWWEGEFLPCWQHFQKVSKRAKQCNRIHNMNSNNTTIIIWHNNWASKLKRSGSTRAEEPWRALRTLLACRALQAARLWECGGGESAKTAGWLSSDREAGLELQRAAPRQPRKLWPGHIASCHTRPAGLFCFLQGCSCHHFQMSDRKISTLILSQVYWPTTWPSGRNADAEVLDVRWHQHHRCDSHISWLRPKHTL